MDLVKTGKLLQELRKEKGFTQEALAERMGVARRTVSRWETGSNMPDLDILMELSDLYEVDLCEILSGERKSEQMNKELKETVLQVADYSNEEEIDGVFQSQLDKLGVEYIDYYLIHNIQTVYYDGYDGNGGIVKTTHLFDHAKKWKEEGKIRHLGISFHSSAKLLDRVLTEHPEIEFVQIALNPIDWDSELVQAGPCYEVICRHDRKVVIMEAIKGGGLAKLPEEAEALLKAAHPDWSVASWSLRFCMGLPNVITVLSGMSTLDQMKDNILTGYDAAELTEDDKKVLAKAMRLYRESAPIKQSEIDQYKGLMYHSVPVTAILQAYSICQIQPDPGFSDDNNYLKNAFAEEEHVDFSKGLEKQTVITEDGKDITGMVEKAVAWLTENTF